MNFAEAAKEQTKFTTTENGAVALNTTSSKLVDFFGTIGALREADQSRIERLFADAYSEDPLAATKIVFYARDIREGLGERQTFRTLIRYMACYHKEAILPNLHLIGKYGRFDDWYSLIGTPIENEMWAVMKNQFWSDIHALDNDKPISLLGKWLKTADASSAETRKLGILTAQKLGMSVYKYKRHVRALRRAIEVTEALMSTNQWDKIEYSAVPSKAMLNYKCAFQRHDEERFSQFINRAISGRSKINSSTLYPYDLVEKLVKGDDELCDLAGLYYVENMDEASKEVIEAQWRQLPNYVDGENAAIVIADTSGSMEGRPMMTSIGLAIYFAERNKGPYHNLCMTFSSKPEYQIFKGETLEQKIKSMNTDNWDGNTDLEASFNLVLDTAIENKVPQEQMPKSLIVISDMEIDYCSGRYCSGRDDWSFYDNMAARFASNGYQIPNIIFWNVDSRHDVFHADATRKGVQLASGQSASIFKTIMECIGLTPVEMVYKVVNKERYNDVTISGMAH